MSSIGERLRQERQRLGYNQEDFAALAECSKKAQIRWEKSFGPTPNANSLASWAKVGADVQYIVTGVVGNRGEPISQDEALWLDYFRAVPGIVRNSAMASLRAAVDYARSEQLSRHKSPEQAGDNT
ncbi:TPA: helix-turn-helix transcriptional regulator [Pseudomonas aeruginosa]|nr:helix-turn-helix transcriptional regulator [Pseudomonas aeruginosa]